MDYQEHLENRVLPVLEERLVLRDPLEQEETLEHEERKDQTERLVFKE